MVNPDFQVGIVGAGFGGLIAALRLKNSGRRSFVIFERANSVGGTWRDNIYPGCACDVHSHLYCIASEPNPNWSEAFSSQPEIWAYMKDVVRKNELETHIRYNTEIVAMQFLEEQGFWKVSDQNGNSVTVKMLILATGPLNRPHLPAFGGLETFKGKYFHSSAWDYNYNLKGKKVAVVGTGASAIQIIPNIADQVAQLYVFQRTPAWVMPRRNRPISRIEKQLLGRVPFAQKLYRELIYWVRELFGLGFVGNNTLNKFMERTVLKTIKKQVNDPELRQKLTPTYQIGCKRVLIADDFYPTFNRANVHLITDTIDRITPNGILAQNGTDYPADLIVFATGFVAADIELESQIIGLNNRSLIDEWRKTGAEAYHGITVSGYPNLAFILGPNTGLGHSSVLHMMESQMNYIMQYIEQLEKNAPKTTALDLKQDAQTGYNRQLQTDFEGTVWASGCKSWYMNRNGKNTTLYPHLTAAFRKETQRFDVENYTLLT